MPLTPPQRARYARQLALPEVGESGQIRLAEARVLIVGAGGLGSPAAYYLAAAGVGTLGLVDDDVVEASNLQRQILHGTADIGRPKIESAAERLQALNPELRVRLHRERFDAARAPQLLSGYDFVIDATDNFAAKFQIADACLEAGKPYSHAGIARFLGQTMTVLPGKSACYRCLFETPPPPPAVPEAPQGPLGALPGVIGAIQATEAIKYVLGMGRLLLDRILVYDAMALQVRIVTVHRRKGCVCTIKRVNSKQ